MYGLHRHSLSTLSLILIILIIFPTSPAQSPTPAAAPSKDEEDAVVRITTKLVQIDVVVVDKNGKQVTDLKAEDFELTEDSRAQKITNFSYVNVAPSGRAASGEKPGEKPGPPRPLPPVQLRPRDVSRTIVIVVDDLNMSKENIYFVRRSMKKFIDEQMQPGDLVSIIKTSGGSGALQLFTSDKRQLQAAVNQLNYSLLSRQGITNIEPVNNNNLSLPQNGVDRQQIDAQKIDVDEAQRLLNEAAFTVGTLGVVSSTIDGLRQLPGRKAVVLFSDGFALFNPATDNSRVLNAFNRLTDRANRASVSVYTINSRGLQTLGITAADNLGGNVADAVGSSVASQTVGRGGGGGDGRTTIRNSASIISNRSATAYEAKQGLQALAEATGGLFTDNVNNGLEYMLEDQRGYYLIGYDPEESTFSGKERGVLHKLEVKVKRPGLRVRARSGFYGLTDEEVQPFNNSAANPMVKAVVSPFLCNEVPVSLTPLVLNDKRYGTVLRSLLYIDGNTLSFIKEDEGWYKCDIDLLAVTFGTDFQIFDQVAGKQTIRVASYAYDEVMKGGITYIVDVPVKKAGAYHFRVAIRDLKSDKIGSANQFVEIPDIKKGKLALSGILTSSSELDSAKTANNAPDPAAQTESDKLILGQRKFKRGSIFNYSYFIYNARVSRSATQLKTRTRLYRDGEVIYTGAPQPFDANGQDDLKRLKVGGRLRIGKEMAAGHYVLQVIVTDELSTEQNRTVTQFIDFEVEE